MYGTDYPCWDPAPCLKLIDAIELSDTDKQKLFYDNARRILALKDPTTPKATPASPAEQHKCSQNVPNPICFVPFLERMRPS